MEPQFIQKPKSKVKDYQSYQPLQYANQEMAYQQPNNNLTLNQYRENEFEIQEQLSNLMNKYTSNTTSTGNNHDNVNKRQILGQKDRDLPNFVDVQNKKQTYGNLIFINLVGSQERKVAGVQAVAHSNTRMNGQKVGCTIKTNDENDDAMQQNDYLYEENDIPIPLSVQFNSKNHVQPKFSKSPKPYFAYENVINTPKQAPGSTDVRMSHQQALQILSQYENGMIVNNRNPQAQILNFKSHDVFNQHQSQLAQQTTTQNNLKDKKKSISSISSSTNGGTFNTINSNKRISGQSKEHKKSQSLYNKKIVDIIHGLQQSLGVIASNVQNSFNNGEAAQLKQNQEKALLESAMLAQKLAHMTSGLAKPNEIEPISKKVHKRKPSFNPKSNQIQLAKGQISSSQNYGNQHLKAGFKTLDADPTIISSNDYTKETNSNRQSFDLNQKRAASNRSVHQRTRSDVQNCRKLQVTNIVPSKPIQGHHNKQQSILATSQFSNDKSNFHQPGLIQSNSQLARFLDEQNYGSNTGNNSKPNIIIGQKPVPQSAKNRQSMNHKEPNNSQNVQMLQPQMMSKISTIENPRGSIQMKQGLYGGERLSEAAYIKSSSKNNPILQGCQGQETHKLRSAASSPSLHGANSVNNSSGSGVPLKRKQNKQLSTNLIFDFGSAHHLQQNNNKITAKKKSIINSKQQVNPNKVQSSSHKRGGSDGSSLTKMFHFKQQMLINKIFSGQTNYGTKKIAQGKQQNTIQYSKVSNLSKQQVTSSLSSKRLSNEIQCEFEQENMMYNGNYSSPRLNIAPQGQNVQMVTDMKKFLEKFKDQGKQPQPLNNMVTSSQDQKQLLIQAIQQQSQLNKQKVKEYNPIHGDTGIKKKPQRQTSQGAESVERNVDKRQSQQIQKSSSGYKSVGNQSLHKRAKSDYHQMANFKSQQKQIQGGQKMFFLNLNQQKEMTSIAAHPIYSARASPTNKQSTYYNLGDDTQKKIGSQQNFLPTARSDKQSSHKLTNVFSSNQTTQKKLQLPTNSSGGQQVIDTPQFNYLMDSSAQAMPKTKLMYNEDYQTLDEKVLQSLQMNKNLLGSIIQFGTSNEKPSQAQQNTIYHSDDFLASGDVKQSPKLKVLPTPKALQPGAPDKPQFFSTNTTKIPQNELIQRNEDNYLETYESNPTMGDEGLSPQSKEKKRLIKMIKVSFRKMKEPVKTTGEFYRIGKMLGKGAFGRVNLAIHKLCEQFVAVKSINKQFLTEDESSKKKVMQEVLILQKTRHKNIVKLFDSFETNKHIVFVMELCAGGDLLNYVRKRRKLKENVAKYVFKQVVDGLYYCHSKGIVHRDIKLDNLLLDETGSVKICDFGVSRLLLDKCEVMTEQCGTPAYIAPEILKDKGYRGFGVDVWSLGVCLYAMLYGTVPFKANNMNELHQLIMKAKYSLKDDKIDLSEEVKSLIRGLLEPDPSKRMTIDKVRHHPWLAEAQDPEYTVEIFTDEEKEGIRKDFTYQDMTRYKRNVDNLENKSHNGGVVTTEHFFTEHALDSTTNALLKNCSTKSIVLAPFNSTRSHLEPMGSVEDGDEPVLPPLEIDQNIVYDKKVIKYAARVKDINRQYEMNNNCELDNGVYNKFVKQSTDNAAANSSTDGPLKPSDLLSQENSLVTSMNNEEGERKQRPQAPLVSQNSDDEMEAELMILKNNHNNQNSELQQIHTMLQLQMNKFTIQGDIPDDELILDYDVVEQVEVFGYPRQFIIESVENNEMNDAGTCYFLLDKDKQQQINLIY